MHLTIVTLLLLLLNSTSVLSVPRQANTIQLDQRWHQNFVKRNETAANTGELTLNIDPDIINPDCGDSIPANINVKTSADPFYLSSGCNKVLNYLGGVKGDKDVDVVFACTGKPMGPAGTRNVNFIFNLADTVPIDGANTGIQLVPANLEVSSVTDNTFISLQVNLAMNVGSEGEVKFQYLYC